MKTGNVSPWLIAAMTLIISSVEAFSLPAGSAFVSAIAGFLPVAFLFKISAVLCVIAFALMGIMRVRFSNDEEEIKNHAEKLQEVV